MRTIYRWQGGRTTRPRRARHCTRASLVAAIVERTNAEHPYEVPGIVAALPITGGGPAYLDRITASTREP